MHALCKNERFSGLPCELTMPTRLRLALLAALALPCATLPAMAGPIDLLSTADVSAGLKEALSKGSVAAGQLGAADGFLGNSRFKIPLPPAVAKLESGLRMFGMGPQADELVTAMNRAAEAAVPEARTLLLESVKKMSVEDAKGILTGGNDAATQYFRRTTQTPLLEKFLPIVHQATAKVGVAQSYNQLAGKASSFGLVKAEDANLDQYVAGKALDSLYTVIGEQEQAIRQDPVGQGTKLLTKVFGAALK